MLVPWVCSQRAQCSSSVASGSAAICARNAAYCPGAILGGRPERGLVATVPRSRRHCRQRVNERQLMPKLRVISAPLRPASAAWSTCSRSSSEYSGRFMPVVCHPSTCGRNRRSHQPASRHLQAHLYHAKAQAGRDEWRADRKDPVSGSMCVRTRGSSLPHAAVG